MRLSLEKRVDVPCLGRNPKVTLSENWREVALGLLTAVPSEKIVVTVI